MSIYRALTRTNPTARTFLLTQFSVKHETATNVIYHRRSYSIGGYLHRMVAAFDNYSPVATLNLNSSSPDGAGSKAKDECGQKNVLPEEISRDVLKLWCESSAAGGICDVYVVGTCHLSLKSSQEVKAVIGSLKPEVVFLELCSDHVGILIHRDRKVPIMRDMVKMWKKHKNMFVVFLSWFYAKLGHYLRVSPGSEFSVAYEEAMKYGGKVVVGDRRIQITMARISKKDLQQDIKNCRLEDYSRTNVEKIIETGDIHGTSRMVQKLFPTLFEKIVDERDQYMSAGLLNVARKHSSVVAVVGKGHLAGIKKYWKQPVAIERLLEVPSK